MIPNVQKSAVLEAIAQFDRDLRATNEWQGWQQNNAHKYAIDVQGQLYPVKQIISMAADIPVSEFSGGEGGGQANGYIRSLGFDVVALHHQNPKWQRDELILALDLYLRHRPHPPGKKSAEIAELSDTLNRLAQALGISHQDTFRNANGVSMKLLNFRRFDPEYTSEGKIGLTRGGKDEEIVWEEFAEDPSYCHKVAESIRQGIPDLEAGAGSQVAEYPDDLQEAEEGRLLTVLHRRRERNRKLVERKKATVQKRVGKLECDVCGFDFSVTYVDRGAGFIECHHTRPVSESTGQKTKLNDLALVCSNCHRMIHAKRPWLSVEELRALWLQQY